MAVDVIGEPASDVKSCRFCSQPFARKTGERNWDWLRRKYCSNACANRDRLDHSTPTLMRRFWRKVDQRAGLGPRGECWHWLGRTDGHGYGEIKIAGAYKKAHRLALFGRGDIDNPLFACHRCDNPRCVRPDHLFAGEPIDNVHDMIAKGRRRA